jgi:hypothetical protein
MAGLVILTLGVLALIDTIVCAFVVRSSYHSPRQKLMQCAIVWLIPIIGPLVVAVFLYSQRDAPSDGTRSYHEPDDAPAWAAPDPFLHDGHGHEGEP